MKRRIEKKRAAIQARRVYHNARRADVVYACGAARVKHDAWPCAAYVCVFSARPRCTGAFPVRCIVEIRLREETGWSYNDGDSIAAWDARCRKYKEARHE